MKTSYQKHLEHEAYPQSREAKLHACINTLGLIARVKDRAKLGIYTEKEKNRLIERLEQRYQYQISKLSQYEEAKERLLVIAAMDIPHYIGLVSRNWFHGDYVLTVDFEVQSRVWEEWHSEVSAYKRHEENTRITILGAYISHPDGETVTNVTDELSEMIEL